MDVHARQTQQAQLEAIVADHYSPTIAPDPATRELEAIARGFVPDPQSEAALVARAKDPAGFEAEMRRVGVSPLDFSIYERQRDAAIKSGTFVPEKGTAE